jgi:hypothetical protein
VRQGDQSADQVPPASRHPDVSQDERGAVLASGRDRRVAVDRLADDAEVALLLEQHGHGRSDARVVVRDDDGDLVADGVGHKGRIAHGTPICRDAWAPLV